MANLRPSATPVTDAVKRRIAQGESTERIIKLSNMTYGRLVTLEASLPKDSLALGDVDFAEDYLRRTREALEEAGAARDAAIKARDKAVRDLEPELQRLNIESQEVSNVQDAIAIILTAVPLLPIAAAGSTAALVIGGAAAAGSFVNSMTRSEPLEEKLPGATADAVGDAVDLFTETNKESAVLFTKGKVAETRAGFPGALKGVSALSVGVEVYQSEGIEAKLDSTTNEGFNRLDEQIDNAGYWVDKDGAKAASERARAAQGDLNRAELVLKMKQAEYIRALSIAEGLTWVRPR